MYTYRILTAQQKYGIYENTVGLLATWRQVPDPQVQVQVQVLRSQVQVRVHVLWNGTRVLLEYKYKYQVLHLWIMLIFRGVPPLGGVKRGGGKNKLFSS